MPDIARYDRATVALHWLTAGLIVVLWLIAEFIDDFTGAGRIYARSAHVILGLALVLAVLARLWWRATGGSSLPPADTGLLQLASTVVHFALYALVLVVLALGVANELVRGDNILDLGSLPSIAPGDTALRGQIGSLHGLAANALLVLAGLHAAAALFHHVVLKDDVLRRMWGRG